MRLLGILLWLGSVSVCLLWLADYSNRPGQEAHAQDAWPATTSLQLDIQRPTLVLVAHPQCACTRASLGELEKLNARRTGRLKIYVLFYQPADQTEDWVKSDLWQAASKLPGVHVLVDPAGRETRRFGAETSGQTFLYDKRGRLVFQGGITAARGHAGDNNGRQAIEDFIDTGRATLNQTPIFGCALWPEVVTNQAENEPIVR